MNLITNHDTYRSLGRISSSDVSLPTRWFCTFVYMAAITTLLCVGVHMYAGQSVLTPYAKDAADATFGAINANRNGFSEADVSQDILNEFPTGSLTGMTEFEAGSLADSYGDRLASLFQALPATERPSEEKLRTIRTKAENIFKNVILNATQ